MRRHHTAVKANHHPLVGEMTFTYKSTQLLADPGMTLLIYTVEPRPRSEQAVTLLASCTANSENGVGEAHHAGSPGTATRRANRCSIAASIDAVTTPGGPCGAASA